MRMCIWVYGPYIKYMGLYLKRANREGSINMSTNMQRVEFNSESCMHFGIPPVRLLGEESHYLLPDLRLINVIMNFIWLAKSLLYAKAKVMSSLLGFGSLDDILSCEILWDFDAYYQ